MLKTSQPYSTRRFSFFQKQKESSLVQVTATDAQDAANFDRASRHFDPDCEWKATTALAISQSADTSSSNPMAGKASEGVRLAL